MYEAYFGLTTKPFELLPNPDFIFSSKSHKRTMTFLDYGIKERAGFILLTGEIGSGKTTIIRDLINKYANRILLSKVFNTNVDSHQLISLINEDFGLPVQGRDKQTLFRELTDFLIGQYAKGTQPVLVIDEAQNLDVEKLEEIRLLSNLENDNAKLLQIILVGQPELRKTLASPKLLQLRQRININCHLQPLNQNELPLYISHRLEIAGNREAVTFTSDAYEAIYDCSRGIPRLVNIICDFLLLSAFAEGRKKVEVDMVDDIIADLDFENHFWGQNEPVEKQEQHHYRHFSPVEHEIHDLKAALFDLSQRLDQLEQKAEPVDLEKIKGHLDRFGHMISQYTEKVSAEVAELKDELREHEASCNRLLPMEEESGTKKLTGVGQSGL